MISRSGRWGVVGSSPRDPRIQLRTWINGVEVKINYLERMRQLDQKNQDKWSRIRSELKKSTKPDPNEPIVEADWGIVQ
jgi:hypothetical protein